MTLSQVSVPSVGLAYCGWGDLQTGVGVLGVCEMGDGRWGMGVSTVGTRRLETFSNLIDSHCQKRKKSPFLPLFSHRQPQDLLSPSGS